MMKKRIIFALIFFFSVNANISSQLAQAQSTSPQNTTIKTLTPEQQQVLQSLIAQYNSAYGEAITTFDQLIANAVIKNKFFYENARQCKAGTYSFPMLTSAAGLVFCTAKIQPLSDGNCKIETIFIAPNVVTFSSICVYQPQQLALFTEQKAVAAAQGTTVYNPSNTVTLESVQQTQCQRYINNKPVP